MFLRRLLHHSAPLLADASNIMAGLNPTKVQRYGRLGFTISGRDYRGSVALFGNLVLHWKVVFSSFKCPELSRTVRKDSYHT